MGGLFAWISGVCQAEVPANFGQAVCSKNKEAVVRYINEGRNPDHAFKENDEFSDFTPLTLALNDACQGSLGFIDWLITNGADPDTKAPNGDVPIIVAASNLDYPMVELLIKKGVDVNQKNDEGETAIMNVVGDAGPGVAPLIVNLLIDSGANVMSRDAKGRPAYANAEEHGYYEIANTIRSEIERLQKDVLDDQQ